MTAQNELPGAIVVGIDGSDSSLSALDWAADAAQRRNCPLRIVHAITFEKAGAYRGPDSESGQVPAAARELVQEAAARAIGRAPQLVVDTEIVGRKPTDALLEEAQTAAALVVGNRGRGGFTGLLVGSVGVQLTAHARCPVFIVRGEGDASGPVVVGVDTADRDADGTAGTATDGALELAFTEAALRGAPLVAVRAWQEPVWSGPTDALLAVGDGGASRATEERLLAESLALWQQKFPAVPVEPRLVAGQPAEELVRASDGAALLVVGARGRGGFGGLLLGSVSHAAIHHAKCPVAVVRRVTEDAD